MDMLYGFPLVFMNFVIIIRYYTTLREERQIPIGMLNTFGIMTFMMTHIYLILAYNLNEVLGNKNIIKKILLVK